LTLRWNGARWRLIHVPGQLSARLFGVAAAGRLAWAVGQAKASYTFIMTWNGRSWHQARSPLRPDGDDFFFAAAAVSTRTAWAAGAIGTCCAAPAAVVVRWNGKTWK